MRYVTAAKAEGGEKRKRNCSSSAVRMSICAGLALWPEGESALTCTYVRASHAAKAWKNGGRRLNNFPQTSLGLLRDASTEAKKECSSFPPKKNLAIFRTGRPKREKK